MELLFQIQQIKIEKKLLDSKKREKGGLSGQTYKRYFYKFN